MPNLFGIFGAQQQKPVRFTPLYNETFATGLWTQRNPLRDAASTRLEARIYGGRNDGLIDGLNIEISNRLTFVRRPGLSVYNSQNIPPIDNFYEFRIFNNNTETIKVMASCPFYSFNDPPDTTVQPALVADVTGPNTLDILWQDTNSVGKTYFQSVGNTLYFSNNSAQMKWVQSAITWQPTTQYASGNFLIDPNNNIQVAQYPASGTIAFLEIANDVLTIQTDQDIPNLYFRIGQSFTLAGLTSATFLNGYTAPITSVLSDNTFTMALAAADSPQASETGTVTSPTGISGATQPAWSATFNGLTFDGTQLWICKDSSVQVWGLAAPTTAPTVSNLSYGPSTYDTWTASTFYSPSGVLIDTNGNIQQLTTDGTTGATVPTWATLLNITTIDGTAVWTNRGSATRANSTAYTGGKIIAATSVAHIPPVGGKGGTTINYLRFYQATNSGTTGLAAPMWPASLDATVVDGTLTWKNIGMQVVWSLPATGQAAIGPTVAVVQASLIADTNNNTEQVIVPGITGTAVPIWNTQQTGQTVDLFAVWENTGPATLAPNTGTWIYAYAYRNSVTEEETTASPLSVPILKAGNSVIVVTGASSPNPQWDTIALYRTTQGESTLFLLDYIPNPTTPTWTYTDNTLDVGLDIEIEAAIDDSNDPPPAELRAMTYFLDRIWGAVNNTVYFSGGPDTTTGDGDSAWPPANVFVFPSQVVRLFGCTLGMLVFTLSDIYIIQGTTTTTFFSVPFAEGIGLLNYSAFSVNGNTLYLFTTDRQLISLDMSSGTSEVGFPIGDQFVKSNWTPQNSCVTWHIAGSPDKGLYVSDGNTGWFRLYPTPAPETGLTWAPFARLLPGCSLIQSVETSPGVHNLLVGSPTMTVSPFSGPILARNSSVFTDNGVAYDAFFTLGSLVLAQPGQLAELVFITTDCTAIGARPSISAQLDEISNTPTYFENLGNSVPDPTQLAPSNTMYSQRFYFSQTQQPALCRSVQVKVDWGQDVYQNELLSLTIFGGYSQEL